MRHGCGPGNDELDLLADQLGGQVVEPVDPALRPAPFDDEVLALHVAEIAQPPAEGLDDVGNTGGERNEAEEADPVDLGRLLCIRSDRRGEDAEREGEDEPDTP